LVLCGSNDEPDGARIDSAGDRYYLGGVAGKRGHGEPLRQAYQEPCRVFGASASSAFYRRETLLRVGGFAESFGAYFEDVDLAFRLHRTGYHVFFEPQSKVYHRISGSYGPPRRHLLEQQSLNEERVFWRNLTGPILRQALPRHAVVLAAKAWRRWQEGSLVPFLCGRLRLLGDIAELRRHHRWLETLGPATEVESWLVERRFWAD
jgi:GT2 family glycosyltransferase